MYNVTLVNLAADARSAAVTLVPIEKSALSLEDLRALLQNFCDLDPVQNVVADPEIRVQGRTGRYLIRTGQKKLFLYDVLNRENPAQVLTLPELMAELDGSAAAARAIPLEVPAQMPGGDTLIGTATAPAAATANWKLLGGMIAAAAILLSAIVYLRLPAEGAGALPPLEPIPPAELAATRLALAGVYMTGSQPGQHGMVIRDNGDLKIFELNAQAPPSVILDTCEPGRRGPKLYLATNQPGGPIEVTDHDALVYCDEIYKRIP